MASTTFTTRIDPSKRAKLDLMAQYEKRTSSYLVKRAIDVMIEDFDHTERLIQAGLQQVARGESISEEAMDSWVSSWEQGEELPFPKATSHR